MVVFTLRSTPDSSILLWREPHTSRDGPQRSTKAHTSKDTTKKCSPYSSGHWARIGRENVCHTRKARKAAQIFAKCPPVVRLNFLGRVQIITISCPSSTYHLSSRQHKQLYGLIIGIDNYLSPKIPDLSGAVADSAAVRAFLSNNQHVMGYFTPHLKYLSNQDATRKAIIRELQALRSDKRIQRGDPILIYYAGHGSSTVSPVKWTRTEDQKENGNIQFIVPYDCDEWVAGIPDRTIAACLDHLAGAKGDNIVSIPTSMSVRASSVLIQTTCAAYRPSSLTAAIQVLVLGTSGTHRIVGSASPTSLPPTFLRTSTRISGRTFRRLKARKVFLVGISLRRSLPIEL